MASIAMITALGLTVAAGYIFQNSILLGILIIIVAVIGIYLNLPMLLLVKELGNRPLPRIAMLFWLMVFGLFNLPKGALVHLNNRVTGRVTVKPKQLHVLVSRCVQWSGCKSNVTLDIVNCVECGKCKIGAIKRLCFAQEVSASVESGGTAAREHLKQRNPQLVLAVACERELLAGVLDTEMPVVGVNIRVGPKACRDCDVQISDLEQRLNYALKEG